jgi:hypothetical protein
MIKAIYYILSLFTFAGLAADIAYVVITTPNPWFGMFHSLLIGWVILALPINYFAGVFTQAHYESHSDLEIR